MRKHYLGLVVLFSLIGVFALDSVRLSKAESITIVVPDNFLTIQEAINNAVDGDTIFVRTGTYYEHIVVNKTVSLLGEDSKATLIDGNGTGRVIDIVSDNVNLTGFTVLRCGSVGWPSVDAGICLNGVTSCNIVENHVINNGFFGISLLSSHQNMITGNNISNTIWGGIHLLSSGRNTISGNVLTNNTYVGINGHASSHYNNITDNVISNSTYGMFYHNANYNNICGNNISRISVEGIWLQDQVSSNIVAENIFLNCSVGIKLLGPNYYNVLSGNFLANGRCGILIQNAQYTEISNNTITHHYGDEWDAGIRLDQAGYSRIYSNLITDNWRGILLYTTSPHVSIYDNSLTYNEFAVRVASGGSNYLNVSDNVVMNNRGYGIGLTGFGGGSNYATISRNQIENNSDGIALGRYSNYNMLLQNNISQNGYGFYIDYSTQNTIWGNNIVGNDQQVYVSTGSANNWNGSYPAGGNYWSDYAGVDIYRGQDQNLPGNDSLGDTPYIIDAGQLDNFPLMEPWIWAPNDIAVEAVTLSKNAVGQGYNLHANVTVANHGVYLEAFNVTLYTNTTLIERREVVLSSGNSTTLTFTWNTSDFAYGNYTIWACAEPVPGEVYTVDNTYVTRIVTVTILGDVDGDRDVDIFDIVQIASIYGVHVPPPDPRFNPNCDIDENGYIEIFDILAAASNYDESW